jgi:DNA polymerase phi
VLVARALLHDSGAASGSSTVAESREVLEAYEASLDDFMRRKATKIRVGLFTDLCSRFPVAAWGLRDSLIKYAREDGANAYRQTQAFAILTELISQIPTLVCPLPR